MTDALRETLKALSEAVAVSGDESEVRKWLRARIADKVESLRTDTMGNLTAIKKGTGQSPLKVMVSAHMDEAGFMVARVGEGGFVSIEGIGKHDLRYLPASRVQVGKDKQAGVFMWTPIHKSFGQNAVQDVDHIQIDVGASGKAGVKAKPGERVAWQSDFREISATVVRGKAFDRSAACAALLSLIEGDPLPFDLHVAFTAQGHITGGRGAIVAARAIQPDFALVLDGILATDFPRDPDDETYTSAIRMGGGAVARLQDMAFTPSRTLTRYLSDTARANGLSIQPSAHSDAKSEAAEIGRRSVATVATLAVPIRYLGTPNALLDLTDLNTMITLARAALMTLSPDLLERNSL